MGNVNSSEMSLTPTLKHSQKSAFLLLLTALATAGFSSSLMPSALAQQNSPPSPPTRESERHANPKPPAATQRREQPSVWAALWKLVTAKREKEPALAARGLVCAISPGRLEEKNVLWSVRPLFLWQRNWQEKLPSFEIRLYSTFSPERDQEKLWSQTVTPESKTTKIQSAVYTGEALLPGQIYDWELVILSSEERVPKKVRHTFQVMGSPERERLAAELAALEAQLKAAGATAEEIALERANYFAQRDLWSDALQEIDSVKNSSVELTGKLQDLVNYLCEPRSTAGNWDSR